VAFSFIHAADLHLDSPLVGLAEKDEALAAAFRQASRRAFDNLVDTAIEDKVDFVVIAGDLFDGDWRNYETGLVFARGMGRLHRAGIPVFKVRGNHDAECIFTKKLELPPNVTVFGSRKAESVELDELGVVLHGRSFAARSCADNLAAAYPPARGGRVNIGVLHTSLGGYEGHEPYAPCSTNDLVGRSYHYWALGHVHAANRVATEPCWIVYPGCLQGRNIRERGPKGAVRVTVRDDGAIKVEDLVLDAARWAAVTVPLNGAESMPDALARVRAAVQPEADRAERRPLAVRIRLEGATPLHGRLALDREALTADVRAALFAVGAEIMVEKVVLGTTAPGAVAPPAALPDGLLAALREACADPAMRAALAGELKELRTKLPGELFTTPDRAPFDPEALDGLLDDATAAALASLCGGERV
jgi:DNA repair exonuclease SbcCD nuclease subunit